MKTPDEIKKGLECCGTGDFGNHSNCPYNITEPKCMQMMFSDALALIQQLQQNNAQLAIDKAILAAENAEKDVRIQQLEAERDELKEALGLMVYQYCVRGDKLDHLYMCAGETAFRVLGLEQYGNTSSLESWLFPEYQGEEE